MEHSAIGPSALHRLLACPGSHQLSKTVPGDGGGSSAYAAEGTVAHALVEQALSDPAIMVVELALGDVVTEDGHDITINQDMVDGADEMIAFCHKLKERAEKVWVEERVDLGFLWDGNPPEPIFGTVDFGAYIRETDTLHVVDFKYGRIPVSPYDNPQPNAYAMGAVHELGHVPKWVTLTIVQPRGQDKQTIKTTMISGLDLIVWAETTLVDGVDALFGPSPSLSTGDHCRFCRAKGVCPALHQLAQDTAKIEFPGIPVSPMKLTNSELGMTMNQVHVLKMWFDEIQAEVSGRVEKGETVPGWKLVPKRATRKWADAKAVEAWGKQHAMGVFKQVLETPTQVQKKLPAQYDLLVEQGLVDQKSSGNTLAPDGDPREAIKAHTAKDEFGIVE